jgi:ABC-type Zn uptake system ZnuABC Zn-binding protein ZnuA
MISYRDIKYASDIAVDLDGTLAKYNGWKGIENIGKPIPEMVKKIKKEIEKGNKVTIFTARATNDKAIKFIKKWLKENDLPDLDITNIKKTNFDEFWDDKAVAIEKNTGKEKC